jgi:hypothetical protein
MPKIQSIEQIVKALIERVNVNHRDGWALSALQELENYSDQTKAMAAAYFKAQDEALPTRAVAEISSAPDRQTATRALSEFAGYITNSNDPGWLAAQSAFNARFAA